MEPIKYVDVYPFACTDKGIRYLLLRRSTTNTYPGIWQPVSGKVKPGESASEAALREFHEETALPALNFFALDHVSTHYLHPSNEIIWAPAFMVEVEIQNPQLNHEHDAHLWLSHEEALETASWNPYRDALKCIPLLLQSSPALAVAKISLKNKLDCINP